MMQIVLKLQLITPLLMFGAFNGGYMDSYEAQPEIRAASIRGGLRYWLRTVYGAAYGSNITGLHEAESRIFGSTSQGSAVTVRIRHQLSPVDFDPNINSGRNDPKRDNALKVLPERFGFAGFEQANASSNQSILLFLVSHPLRRDVFNPAFISALFLAFTLGGFGKRARRGGGALQIVGINGDDVPDILRPLTVQNGSTLAEVLKTSIFPYIERAVLDLPGTPYAAGDIPAYPVFAPDHSRVFVGTRGSDNYLDALKQMWTLTGKPPGSFHRQYSLDRSNNQITTRKESKKTGEVTYEPIPDEWAWGYTLNNRQIERLDKVLGERRLGHQKLHRSQRRASALHMRVYQCEDGKYYPIVTFFHGGQPQVNNRLPQDENQKWGRIQQVIDLFDKHSDFERAFADGNTTRW